MKCFYHNDNDGKASAFCVRKWANKDDEYSTTEVYSFIPIDYNNIFPLENIRKDEKVWIVDFSISPEEMEQLLIITKDVTWIDHHISAIRKYNNSEIKNLRGIRHTPELPAIEITKDSLLEKNEAACTLTFKYIMWFTDRGDGEINFNSQRENKKIPMPIALIGDRDCWEYKYGEKSNYFHEATFNYDLSSESNFFDTIIGNNFTCLHKLAMIMKEGKFLYEYNKRRNEYIVKQYGFHVKFHEYNCLALNTTAKSSDALDGEENLDKYDILIPFYYYGGLFHYSLYTNKENIDVSKIAEVFGGGGHKNAAGFRTTSIIF
jgi:hypothetical protein